mmetsp:Transcript_2996/g.4993  ORF Transcript_2996/g.4993 Transcript_2996/m.4993 type:complete len:289 (-) Transcript_2996:222-1088(-)
MHVHRADVVMEVGQKRVANVATIKDHLDLALNLSLDVAQLDDLHLVGIHQFLLRSTRPRPPSMLPAAVPMMMVVVSRMVPMVSMATVRCPVGVVMMAVDCALVVGVIVVVIVVVVVIRADNGVDCVVFDRHRHTHVIDRVVHFEDDDIGIVVVLNLLVIVEQLRLGVDAQNLRQLQARRHVAITLRQQRVIEGERANERAANQDERDERFVQSDHPVMRIGMRLTQTMYTNDDLTNRDEEVAVFLNQLRQIHQRRLAVHLDSQRAYVSESVAKRSEQTELIVFFAPKR